MSLRVLSAIALAMFAVPAVAAADPPVEIQMPNEVGTPGEVQAPARTATPGEQAPVTPPEATPRNPNDRDPSNITVTGEREQEPASERIVCRSSVSTGSIMPRRTCRTAGEWERIRQRSIETLDRMSAERRARQHVQESVDNQ